MSLEKLIFIWMLLITLYSCELFTESNEKIKDYEDNVDISSFTIENYPKVDGSTSALPLQRVLACKIFDVNYIWFDGFDEYKYIFSNDEDSTKTDEVNLVNNIWHNGTHESYVNLIQKNADIIIVAREPAKDELSLASANNVEISTTAIALDAFVFILNTENPINNLSAEQIIGIYSGAIVNWNSLGGKIAAINPYQRNKYSGSQELMELLVMKETPMVDSPELLLFSMMGPINKLSTDPNGIAYTVYFFNGFMAPRDNIKICEINGVYPEPKSLSDGSYNYTTKVYVAVRSEIKEGSPEFLLWKWLQTKAGQITIGESGYIPYLD